MSQVVKFTEWRSGSCRWYVSDVHTWTGWRSAANIFEIGEDIEQFIGFLQDKYKAVILFYREETDLLCFYWPDSDYKNAHQFKLDVNRIARKKNYIVEKKF